MVYHSMSNFTYINRMRGKVYMLEPERWRTLPGQEEARGNPGGRPQRYWRANRSSDL